MIPSFGGFFFTILAFVVALSVIVAVHEYGHYIVGRWCGIHAEVFSLGFGPVIWSGHDKHGTKWQLAALPFGGFVKFLGDADAASGKDGEVISTMTDADRARTMHGAKLWKRAATVAAGPVFNFILSILVFGAIFLTRGTATDVPTIGTLLDMPAPGITLQEGDVITGVEGQGVENYTDLDALANSLPPAPTLGYTVQRDGRSVQAVGPFVMPPVALGVQPRSAAIEAGIKIGDVVTAVNGQPVYAFDELRNIVTASQGTPLSLQIWRAGETIELELAPRSVDLPTAEGGFEKRWLIGVSGGIFFEPATYTPGVIEALGDGVDQTLFIVRSSLSGLYHMVTGAISTCNISGPIGIAEVSGAAASQGIGNFIWFIAVLSTAVGLLNLFPIPVLDGGHLVFHAFEAVVGRPPSDKALKIMMSIGLALLLTLMVFAVGNDLFC